MDTQGCQEAYLRITKKCVQFNVAIGGLQFVIRKYISEQQSRHIQCDGGGVSCSEPVLMRGAK